MRGTQECVNGDEKETMMASNLKGTAEAMKQTADLGFGAVVLVAGKLQ